MLPTTCSGHRGERSELGTREQGRTPSSANARLAQTRAVPNSARRFSTAREICVLSSGYSRSVAKMGRAAATENPPRSIERIDASTTSGSTCMYDLSKSPLCRGARGQPVVGPYSRGFATGKPCAINTACAPWTVSARKLECQGAGATLAIPRLQPPDAMPRCTLELSFAHYRNQIIRERSYAR